MILFLTLPTIFTVNVVIHRTKLQSDKFNVLVLYYNISSVGTALKYNIELNEGLEFAIKRELEGLGLKYEIIRFETSRSHLNKTFLDSFYLIVVGGIYYWWRFASNKDRIALYETSTPILASVHYGVGPNSTLINKITGVWSEKIEILHRNTTLLCFTNNSQRTISGTQHLIDNPAFNFRLIDTNVTGSAKILAWGVRGEGRYPLLVYNGTKNILINAFTYKYKEAYYDLWEWPKLLLIAIDYLFDVVPDNILKLKMFPVSETIIFRLTNIFWFIVNLVNLRLIFTYYIIATVFIFLIHYQAINIKCLDRFQIKISIKQLRKTIFRSQQVSLILTVILFYIYSFMPNVTLLISDVLTQIILIAIALTITLRILETLD